MKASINHPMFEGPELLKNKLLNVTHRVDLNALGISMNSLSKLVNNLPWKELSLRSGNVRPISLNLVGKDNTHALLVLFFAIVQNVCLTIRNNQSQSDGLSGAIIYTMLFYFIVLCQRVSSVALSNMLRGIDLCNFDITWLVCITESGVKSITGMIRVPLHWSFNRNMFIFLGPMNRANDILRKNKKKKFAIGRFVKNSSTLLLELIEFCMLISPVVYGVRMLRGMDLLKVYVKLGESLSRNKKLSGLVPAAFVDFVELFNLLRDVCEKLGLRDMFAEGLCHFIPANVVDLAILINVLENLSVGGMNKPSVIYWFMFAGDYYECHGNELVLKYYHSDLRAFDEIWIWRKW